MQSSNFRVQAPESPGGRQREFLFQHTPFLMLASEPRPGHLQEEQVRRHVLLLLLGPWQDQSRTGWPGLDVHATRRQSHQGAGEPQKQGWGLALPGMEQQPFTQLRSKSSPAALPCLEVLLYHGHLLLDHRDFPHKSQGSCGLQPRELKAF